MLVTLLMALSAAGGLRAAPEPSATKPVQSQDLESMSIEDLMAIEITTVSKQERSLSRTAAAVYVITREDIRRSGAANIPDLLRTVPGIHVSQLNAHQWAISARGFSEVYASNMLVLVDGRNLYTPFFSGVYWDTLDVPLEDIQRIEVVRGPGGTTWGANAVNGVINIITSHSADTQGVLLSANRGMRDQNGATVRFGGTVGAGITYRLYTKHTDASPFDGSDGHPSSSDWTMTQGGFRLDGASDRWGSLAVHGTFYGGRIADAYSDVVVDFTPTSRRAVRQTLGGGSIQADWQMRIGGRISQMVRTYVDTWRREGLEDSQNVTTDLDWQQTLQISDHHALVYGAGVRQTTVDYRGTMMTRQLQDKRLVSTFVQSNHEIVPEKLDLSIGSKFEHDSLSGLNVQPSFRLSYAPRARVEVWTAVTRAVRTPNWAERSLNTPISLTFTPSGVPNYLTAVGNPAMEAETLMAYEAGTRLQAGAAMSFDVAVFWNRYSGLQTLTPGPPVFDDPLQPTQITTPYRFSNGMEAASRGFEVAALWQPLHAWKLSATYTGFGIRALQGAQDFIAMQRIDSTPRHQHGLISSVDLPGRVEWTTTWMHSGERRRLNLRSFHRLDSNLLWHVTRTADLGFGCRNLTGEQVIQYDSVRGLGILPEYDPGRRFFVRAAFRF